MSCSNLNLDMQEWKCRNQIIYNSRATNNSVASREERECPSEDGLVMEWLSGNREVRDSNILDLRNPKWGV